MLKILSTLLIVTVAPMAATAQTSYDREVERENATEAEAIRQSDLSQPAATVKTPAAPEAAAPAPEAAAPAPQAAAPAPEALSPNDIKIAAELQSLESEVSNAMATIADDSARFRMITQMNNLNDSYEKVKGNINRKTYRDMMGKIARLRREINNAFDPQPATTPATNKENRKDEQAEKNENRQQVQEKRETVSVTVNTQNSATPNPVNVEFYKKQKDIEEKRINLDRKKYLEEKRFREHESQIPK